MSQQKEINDDSNDCNVSIDESSNDSEATNVNIDTNKVTYSLRKRKKRKLSNDKSVKDVNDELDNDNDSDYNNEFDIKKRKINKLKFNTHQCYVCFKVCIKVHVCLITTWVK